MPPTIKILGYAGLIPFISLAVLSIVFIDNGWVVDTLALYAFGIFSFLCGAWWPTADMQEAKFGRIVFSNSMFLVAFFTYLFLPQQWLAIGAFLLVIIWAIEQFSSLIPVASITYGKMRTLLTAVASLSMIITYVMGVA